MSDDDSQNSPSRRPELAARRRSRAIAVMTVGRATHGQREQPRTVAAGAACVGTAGWSIPRAASHLFEGEGTHLQRYAQVFTCAEINSSFHRPHAPGTYARWAASTPDGFRFSVKVPKEITHVRRLRQSRAPLERFLDESSGLGAKRGPLLVQLPPSFAFDARVVGRFLSLLRSLYDGPLAFEPRHASWFGPADALLVRHEAAQVGADPACVPAAAQPGGWSGLVYYRLHGRPRMYWSSYGGEDLDAVATSMRGRAGEVWCIFDNTASGAAIENAWQLQQQLSDRPRGAHDA